MATNDSYPHIAPIFADADANADIIGMAITAHEALAIYEGHFAGTGETRKISVEKACPDRRGIGPVDGWVPIFAGEN